MRVNAKKPFATANVVPFRKRLGLMGLADAAADAAAAEFGGGGVAPMADVTAVPNFDYAALVSAQNAQATQAARASGFMPGESAGIPSSASGFFSPGDLVRLAQIGANAYVASGQTQVGIAPPGYTYRGYATNITSGYGNLAPPGYSNAGIYSTGYPYVAGVPYSSTPYAAVTPQYATGTISTNTLLLLGGLAAVIMIANKHDEKPSRK